MGRNLKADGSPRRGRPPGPTPNRGPRPWDIFRADVILYVAANPDLERFKIAEALGLSLNEVSRITCSPRGTAFLKEIQASPPPNLGEFRLLLPR